MCAWSKTDPLDDSLLINLPGVLRSNWEALEAQTTAALQITDIKVADGAAIKEAKTLFSATGHGHTSSTDGKLIALTSAVGGILPIANGGTGSSSFTSVPSGVIALWSGSIASIPSGWVLCNGSNGSPDLRDKFIVGAGSTYAVAATGGATTHDHDAVTADPAPGCGNSALSGNTRCVTGQHTHAINSDSSLPPYYALCYIYKT